MLKSYITAVMQRLQNLVFFKMVFIRILVMVFIVLPLKKQAERWALTRKGNSIVNCYKYVPKSNLKVLTFNEISDEWLDFVAN